MHTYDGMYARRVHVLIVKQSLGRFWGGSGRRCGTGAVRKSADDSQTGPRRGGVTHCRAVRVRACTCARAIERGSEGVGGGRLRFLFWAACQIVCACAGARGRERACGFIHKSVSSLFDVGSRGPASTCVFDIQQLLAPLISLLLCPRALVAD